MKVERMRDRLEGLANPMFRRLDEAQTAALYGGYMTFDLMRSTSGGRTRDTVDDADSY